MKDRRTSPFRPTFGVNPPTVAGRDEPLGEFGDALDAGPGAAARICLASGARGIGKTVLLNQVEEEARRRGWLVISETLAPGLLRRLEEEHLPEARRQVRGVPPDDPTRSSGRRRITGVTLPVGLGGVTTAIEDAGAPTGLRSQLAGLCDVMTSRGSGVLLTLDELHRTTGRSREDFESIAAAIQHLWRQEKDIAFFGAGLPAAVQDLLTDRVITFLRRAERFDLQRLGYDDAAEAIAEPIRAAGRDVDDEALGLAVDAAAGYPYMVQIIGDLAWKVRPDHDRITADDVRGVVDRAVRSLGEKVHAPAVADLSEKDREFLRAMVPDDGSTLVRDVMTRIDVDHGWVSRYRSRLLVAGMIRADGRGRVAFALPYLREFLQTSAPWG